MRRWDIFCRVIDNFGDIAVSWRLARALVAMHGLTVRLWVDEITTLARLVPAIDALRPQQVVDGVEVRRWAANIAEVDAAVEVNAVADVVVEAFGCGLPEAYAERMAARTPRPLWIVLEYLSAEPWVGTHHRLPSPHPRLDVPRFFFFPGVTAGSGGLLCEADLAARQAAFDSGAREVWWQSLNLAPPPPGAVVVSVFGYAGAPYAALWQALQRSAVPVVVVATHGHAADALTSLAGSEAVEGVSLRVIPFLPQAAYDTLLWACDVNFVRGEDSFARAQWAARPFVWQLYPQAERAHEIKLDAFLDAYAAGGAFAPGTYAAQQAMVRLWHAWNGVSGAPPLTAAWADYAASLVAQRAAADRWREHLKAVGELSANLVQFVKSLI